MFRQQFTKLDAFGVQDCGLTGDSCGQPLFSHKPAYWWKSKSSLTHDPGMARDGCICATRGEGRKRDAYGRAVSACFRGVLSLQHASSMRTLPVISPAAPFVSRCCCCSLVGSIINRHCSHVGRHQGQRPPPDVERRMVFARTGYSKKAAPSNQCSYSLALIL